MGIGQQSKEENDKKKRLKLRDEGQHKRCPECGRVGLQGYEFIGEVIYGWLNDRKFQRYKKKINKLLCRYCQVEFKEAE